MKPRFYNSLQRKLTRRMIWVQMLSLTMLFGFGVSPLVIYPALTHLGSAQTLDPDVTRILASALVGIENGRIAVDQTPALTQLLNENPQVFAYIESAGGETAVIGTLPRSSRVIISAMASIDTLDVRWHNDEESLLVRQEQSSIGPVRVLIGNGPMVGIAGILRKTAIALALATWGVLTIASILAIPSLVRRELRGLKLVAEDAEAVDFDTRGKRLREEGVPNEILALVRAVNSALARLDQSYASRQRFLAAAAHEVRTPIAILQMRLEESPPFEERQKLLLDVARLATLAEELLELQRLEFAQPIQRPVDTAELAEEVVGDLAPLAITSGYELAVTRALVTHPVIGDRQGISRAIANLVQNAIAHAGGKGEIVVHVDEKGDVSVSDAGRGVPEEERARIFEPFQRLRNSPGGVGLGLNLVETIMKLHGGTVTVGTSLQGGAQFTLNFPPDALPRKTDASLKGQT